MTFRMPPAPGLPRLPKVGRGPRYLLPALGVLAVLVVAGTVFTAAYTDLLWFRSVGAAQVFTTRLWTQVMLFAVLGVVGAAVVIANVLIAYRLRPPFRPLSPEQQNLERYRLGLQPYRRLAVLGLAVAILLLAGSSAAAQWRTWLLWRNAVPFGTRDAQFNRDISYFMFTYPFQRFVLGFLFFLAVLSLLGAALTHYLYGGLRLQTPGDKVTPAGRAHLSVLLGLFVLLKAVAYWLDRYGLSYSRRGFVDTGASYTDVNVVLPAKTILVMVALLCALLFFANVFWRGWLLPAAGLGLLVFAAFVIGGVWPAVIQRFQVKPSEVDKERIYIQRHIAATRQAYGLVEGQGVVTKQYAGTPAANAKDVRGNTATLSNIRLLDPSVLQNTYQQLQGFKSFYQFPDTLDVDRYAVQGKVQEEVVGVRDINVDGLTPNQRNWINQRLVYTHGYGLVAAPGNVVDTDGKPRFDEGDIPSRGDLQLTEPRVYFGENSPAYSVVGAPAGAAPRELDYTTADGGQAKNTYTGRGGVEIGSTFRRVLFALRFKEKNLLLSSGVNSASRILYIRQPRERVQKVAPWLTLDGDPYPAVVGGRIVWIVDGYTTSDGYPYSERRTLSNLTADALTSTSASVAAQKQAELNYIRNSVKAVVDSYDGTVTLYQWGPRDPVLQTWMRAFPGLVKPTSAVPPDLLSHFRYPEDLFKVQRDLLTRYHISDPGAFYNGSDYWAVPLDPTNKSASAADQPPYYLTLAMPGETQPSFRITTALLANNKRSLAAFVAVNSDPTSPAYGKLEVLQLPSNTQVDGPGQIANNFETFAPAATELSLLRRGGSDVELGNLLTLPLGGGVLYVEPVYVRSTGATSYPLLQRVLASYNGTIAYKPTLAEALDVVLGGSAPGVQPPPSSGGGTTPPPSGNLTAAVRQAIAAATQAYADGQAALRKGDFTAYGAAQARLQAALQRLDQLTRGAAAPAASPSPSP